MEIRPIRTKADYRSALTEIETLMAAEPDTFEGERLDVLVTLVEAYENRRYRFDLPDPVEAIKFRMEQKQTGGQFLTLHLTSKSRNVISGGLVSIAR